MTPLFKKLNLKDQPALLVLNAPASFEPELAQLANRQVLRQVPRQPAGDAAVAIDFAIDFLMGFAQTQQERDTVCAGLVATQAEDPVLWVCYPKRSSKRLRGEFHRDSDWAVLAASGFEPVRQVAIDEDWSALRFRRVQHIAQFTRGGAISAEGQRRLAK